MNTIYHANNYESILFGCEVIATEIGIKVRFFIDTIPILHGFFKNIHVYDRINLILSL